MGIMKGNKVNSKKILKLIAKTSDETEIYNMILDADTIEVTLAGVAKINNEQLLKRLALHYSKLSDGRFRTVIKAMKSEDVVCQLCLEATGHPVVHDAVPLLSSNSLMKIAADAADKGNRIGATFLLPVGSERDRTSVVLLKYLKESKQLENPVYMKVIAEITSQEYLKQVALIEDDSAVFGFGNYEMQCLALERIADERILYELLVEAHQSAEEYHKQALKNSGRDLSQDNKYTFYENAIANICGVSPSVFKKYHSLGLGSVWLRVKLGENTDTISKAQIIEMFIAGFESLITSDAAFVKIVVAKIVNNF